MAWRLPTPPSAEELQRHTPRIPGLAGDSERPFWSVMIPTYNCARYLEKALASVLGQDAGREAMQIEVVDDCSTADDPAGVVARLGGERMSFYRNPVNRGPTETFNVCLQRSRGRWVHVLHGDDLVMPGFYDECRTVIASVPDLVMVLGQVVTIDEEDRWLDVIGPPPPYAGRLIPDFLRLQALGQIGQFAGLVVKREAYERVGGFCTLFGHVADRDMWFRVGQLGAVWCTRRPYGLYRMHGGADTGQQMMRGTNIREFYLSTQINLERLAADSQAAESRLSSKQLARRAYSNARKLYARGLTEGSLNQVRWALRLNPTPKALSLWFRSWLRDWWGRTREKVGAAT